MSTGTMPINYPHDRPFPDKTSYDVEFRFWVNFSIPSTGKPKLRIPVDICHRIGWNVTTGYHPNIGYKVESPISRKSEMVRVRLWQIADDFDAGNKLKLEAGRDSLEHCARLDLTKLEPMTYKDTEYTYGEFTSSKEMLVDVPLYVRLKRSVGLSPAHIEQEEVPPSRFPRTKINIAVWKSIDALPDDATIEDQVRSFIDTLEEKFTVTVK